MTEKKVTNEIKKLIKISQKIFLDRVLSISKSIENITKNKWYKFQRPMSNASGLYYFPYNSEILVNK